MSNENGKYRYAKVPSEEWTRYMAIFYRAIEASARYVETQDTGGIWIAGWILDAIHNLPSMLRNYSETAWHSPSKMEEWIRQWSDFQQGPEHPDWMVTDCREIFSFDFYRNLQTLGLNDESQLVRPPDVIADILLDRLYQWCIELRWRIRLQDFRNTPDETQNRRHRYLGAFAKGLLPAPLLLVSWSEKGWSEYRQRIQIPPAELLEEDGEYSRTFFEPIRSWNDTHLPGP